MLDELYLEPAVRGRGYGRHAIAHLEARVQTLGFDLLRMEVNHHNNAAKRFYLALGYCDEHRDLLSRRLNETSR